MISAPSVVRLPALALLFAGVASAPATAQTPARQITESGKGAYEVSLTPEGDGFAAAWYDTRSGNPEIYARLLDRHGAPSGPERRITSAAGRAYEADVAAIGGNLAIGWYEVGANRDTRAMLGLWTRAGERLWSRALALPERISKNPVVRTTRTEIFCAWIAENGARDLEVYAAWFDTSGNPTAPAQRLGFAGRTTWNLNATIDDRGRAWVVFDAHVNTRADEIFIARVDKTANMTRRVTADDGAPSKYPDMAVARGRIALTWFDERDGNKEVYLFVAPESELVEGFEARATRITSTPGESIGAYIAWNARSRRFGLAWCDNSVGQHEVYFLAVDERGLPVGAARRLTSNRTDSTIPAIKPAGNGFALAWGEYTPDGRGTHESDDARSEIAFAIVR